VSTDCLTMQRKGPNKEWPPFANRWTFCRKSLTGGETKSQSKESIWGETSLERRFPWILPFHAHWPEAAVPISRHLGVRRGCAMFDEWDSRFDLECGAEIGSVETDELVDSGVRDWLYGNAGPPRHTEPRASLLATASRPSPARRVSLRLVTREA
jgi:hypothetical protein